MNEIHKTRISVPLEPEVEPLDRALRSWLVLMAGSIVVLNLLAIFIILD